MRIALVHSFYSGATPSGENEVVLAQLAALQRAGHEVVLTSLTTDDGAQSFGFAARAAVAVATGVGRDPSEDLSQFQPDVVHVHNLFPNFGTAWMHRWQGPLVVTLHNFRTLCAAATLFRDGHDCVECPLSGSAAAIRHRCYRGSAVASAPLAWASRGAGRHTAQLVRPDQVITLSPRAEETFNSVARVDLAGRLRVVPNFAPSTEGVADVQARDAWIMAGRLTPEKGSLELIRHWPGGQPLDVLGTGPDEDACRFAARDKDIRFLGTVSRAAVASHLRDARGLVLPSLWREGIPTIYLEALAAGVPTVATAGNSAADDILAAGTGTVISSLERVTEGLERVAKSSPALRAAARRRYEARFTEQVWASDIEAVYDAAIKRVREGR